MQSYQAPLRDIRFSLEALNGYGAHYAALGAPGLGLDDAAPLLDEAAKFAERVLAPCYASGDAEGAQLRDGRVLTPSGFAAAYRQYVDAGWPQLGHDEALGGQPCPYSLRLAITECFQSANQAWTMVPALSDGAIKTLRSYAAPEQIAAFVPKLVSGEWTATMCLTEPQAGSDLGLLRARAVPSGEGRYRISGSKIFISNGDHDLADNIVHLVLARLPDAPPGVRGISLFVVPKRRLRADGSAGDANGVSCVALEHKMGLKGNATCTMAFEDAEGWLVGAPHRGLAGMFVFINKSRLGVAQQAQGHAEAAHQIALSYANTRQQGRAPNAIARADQPADRLLDQPDIRRMLLTQKAVAEGGRALVHYCAKWIDLADHADAEQRMQAERMLALLTPIAKGALSELASEAVDLGVQILGGHGYMREWGLEQRVRDVRVTRIYEGTTGIQALDLLARKVLAGERETLQHFTAEILAFAEQEPAASFYVASLRAAVIDWRRTSDAIAQRADTEPELAAAVAVDYLMLAGYVCLAYVWARAASVAAARLQTADAETDFHTAKLDTARFYFARMLPRIEVHKAAIASGSAPLDAYAAERAA